MTVKKPIYASEYMSELPPYPTTPISPTDSLPGKNSYSPRTLPKKDETMSNHEDLRSDPDVLWTKEMELEHAKQLRPHQVGEGNPGLSLDIRRDSAPQPPLRTDVTPRSSSDSRESARLEGGIVRPIQINTSSDPAEALAERSNNPYFQARDVDTAPATDSKIASNIPHKWATESPKGVEQKFPHGHEYGPRGNILSNNGELHDLQGPEGLRSNRTASYTNELQELDGQDFNNYQPVPHFQSPQRKPVPSTRGEQSSDDKPPILPPRPSNDDGVPPSQPPRPQNSETVSEQQQARVKQQRSETYQIRLVNWFDASSSVNPRRLPIMVQNANGPCPLLALVNALVLSTPFGVTTALVETLRVREQVSLGLLLDAVIDELMSGRRGDAAQNLPDVSELYGFLVNLHTGMNVNPTFINPTMRTSNLIDASDTEQMNIQVDVRRPGGFEETKAMKLYSTFAISLIHGWLPRRNHPVCAALERSAKTYEDAQSLMFTEEELENKLHSQGLDEQEQRTLEDVGSVKYFLNSSPTQLTDYGLDTITETLAPGSVAILFRNDHFSTLYKYPRTGQIFTLVTDMGYAGHDEVVWESLVDVTGEGSEFFSGDFRPVGNHMPSQNKQVSNATGSDDVGWTTVSRTGGHGSSKNALPKGSKDRSSDTSSTMNAFSSLTLNVPDDSSRALSSEQEDHDLALAMQLQEEEEDRHRQEEAARRREDELSRAYLGSEQESRRKGFVHGADYRPQVPPRGSKRAPKKQPVSSEDSPPPSYEQAAQASPYSPVTNYSPHAQAFAGSGHPPGEGLQRQSSAYSATSAAYANLGGSPMAATYSGRSGRRRNTAGSPAVGRGVHSAAMHGVPVTAARRQQDEEGDKKDCIVM
ncbi:MAG: hypothetical protein Q9167_006109 [Letrouitia subvulpina]